MHHDPEFTPSALAILLEIAWPMSSLGQYSWPSLDTIAEHCNLSKSRVGELVNKLVVRDHLIAEGGSAGRGHSTHYRINIIGASAPVTSFKNIVADVLDRDPTPLKGTLAGPFDTKPRTLKGTLAGQNKKGRKKELRDGVPNTTESAVKARSLDRAPESLGHVTPDQDAASLPVNTTALDAPMIPEIKSAPVGALINSEESKPTNTVSMDAAFYKRGGDEIEDGGAAKRSGEPRRETAEHLAWRRSHFDSWRRYYPNQPAAKAAAVEALLARMLLDKKSFVPMANIIKALELAAARSHVERVNLPPLKFLLEKNWIAVHGRVIEEVRK